MHSPQRPQAPRRTAHGFTLLEVMVVVAIIGILSMVAYPSYRDYILRGNLSDATNALATARADMERHFQDNRSYMTVGSFTTPCGTAQRFGTFTLDCAATPTATTYTLRAVGSGSTAGFEYRVTQDNVQSTTAVATGSGYATCATAWIVKKGQACS